jgi:hypothetical protein
MKMNKQIFVLLLSVATGVGCNLPGASPESKPSTRRGISGLWGLRGELWSAQSRLPDYSFAGYHSGRRTLPDVPPVANVKDFGAAGDGIADDTAAFESALASVRTGGILVPRGRYRITRPITLDKSGVVLKGEDRDETVLLAGTVPGNCSIVNQGPPNCAPYHGLAMLQIIGKVGGAKLADVVSPAKRGERKLHLSSTRFITAGQFVRLRMKNPADNSLGCHLYAGAGCLNAERRRWYAGRIVDWVVAVASVDRESITFARPLRLDVRQDWSPEIWSFDASVQESGIENLTIRFSGEPYAGHNDEQGHYAVFLQDAYNSWVRDVTIIDADRGIEVSGGHNTISGVILRAQARAPKPTANTYATGHFGLSAGRPRAQDNLFVDSRLETVFVHNLSVASFANGNVFSRITSQVAHFDHHGGAPYDNLYTEITLTRAAEDLFKSGGNRLDEPNGTRTTLWNVVYHGSLDIGKSPDKLPGLNIIGLEGLESSAPEGPSPNWWIESWSGADTLPANLYEAQLKMGQ